MSGLLTLQAGINISIVPSRMHYEMRIYNIVTQLSEDDLMVVLTQLIEQYPQAANKELADLMKKHEERMRDFVPMGADE